MPTNSLTISGSIGGISIQGTVSRTVDGQLSAEVSLAAGKAGSLTTRTDNNTGEATLATGHGITDGAIVDVYWDGGMRYGMTVGTVAGDVVPIDGGGGDNLPVEDTDLVVCVQTEINLDFDGDDVKIVAAMSNRAGHLDFQDSADASLAAVELAANEPWSWVSDTGVANPLTGNAVDKILVSNGDSANTATLKIAVGYDVTP